MVITINKMGNRNAIGSEIMITENFLVVWRPMCRKRVSNLCILRQRLHFANLVYNEKLRAFLSKAGVSLLVRCPRLLFQYVSTFKIFAAVLHIWRFSSHKSPTLQGEWEWTMNDENVFTEEVVPRREELQHSAQLHMLHSSSNIIKKFQLRRAR
jgi:hypothetical protein